MEFVGLDNFRELLADGDAWAALAHTLYYIVGYLPLVFLGRPRAAAVLDTASCAAATCSAAAYFLPVVTSWVVVALLWRWLLEPGERPGQPGCSGWSASTGPAGGPTATWAMPSVILASAWKDLGFVMIILLAGLQAIAGELYEAATRRRRQRVAAVPARDAAAAVAVAVLRGRHQLINGFQVFDQVWVMTDGGPAGSPTVVVEQIFNNTFRYGRAGYASALAWCCS